MQIAVEIASNRQTNGRARHKIGMSASYSRSLPTVNPAHRPTAQLACTHLQSASVFARSIVDMVQVPGRNTNPSPNQAY